MTPTRKSIIKSRSLQTFMACLSLLLISLFALVGCSISIRETSDDDLQEAEVIRVVDGDTLLLDVDGERERVRLIGINCPESVAADEDRNTPEGVDASNYTKTLVKKGDRVWLETDTNDRDQYDRLLRYVWLEKPEDVNDPDEIENKMLNGILVRDGYAQARRYGEDDLHIDVLRELGREAIDDGRGVTYAWS